MRPPGYAIGPGKACPVPGRGQMQPSGRAKPAPSPTLAPVPVADLPRRHQAEWTRATRHPFLTAVGDGTLSEAAFDGWLVQDHHFVCDLLRFQALLLSRAPRPAQAVLAGGAVALVDELAWFEQRAAARRLDLDAASLAATDAYATLLERLAGGDVGVALVGLWAIERSYLDAWCYAAPGAPAYRQFVEHWTTAQFASYVAALESIADAAAGAAADGSQLSAVFLEVVEAEAGFWDMAWTWRGP